MKRRTNLFYSDESVDSKFLTFSNYTEHLTGVILATNFKMFPSGYYCIHIPSLDAEYYQPDVDKLMGEGKSYEEAVKLARSPKQAFIEDFLVGYYENKLAILRDKIVTNTENADEGLVINDRVIKNPDEVIPYLGYLIDTIAKFDDKSVITYQSEITESDYNGTFTDIICTISSSSTFGRYWKILASTDVKNDIAITDDADKNFIHGWAHTISNFDEETGDTSKSYEFIGPKSYENVKPIFDYYDDINGSVFYLESSSKISIAESSVLNDSIEFNIIIPVYDVNNFDPLTNTTIIYEDLSYDNTESGIILDPPDSSSHVVNVPYGIWFAGQTIKLTKDNGTNYAPSWSLLIGTQFKPFPTSNYLEQDSGDESKMGGFATFAEVLSRQAELYDNLDNYIAEKKVQINNFLQESEDKINTILERANEINSIYEKLNTVMQIEKVLEIKTELEEYLKKLKESDEFSEIGKYKWQYSPKS